MPSTTEARLAELGIALPDAAGPAAAYLSFVVSGPTVYISGQISRDPDGLILGKLGDSLDAEAGAAAARTCALHLIAHLKVACGGDLDRLVRVVKLTGFVNSAPDFTEQPKVINGCSETFIEISATGAATPARRSASPPWLGVAVEVEGVFEIA